MEQATVLTATAAWASRAVGRVTRLANGRRPARQLGLCLALAAGLSGCTHIGPGTVPVDRSAYGVAIAESWKQQTLLSIVKLRYLDLPVFLDVSSVVSGYSLERRGKFTGRILPESVTTGDYMEAGVEAVLTDRPTITYSPMTGEKFRRGLLTPIDPRNIFLLLQAGYPADFVLGMMLDSLNGVRNQAALAGTLREADPDFAPALRLLREVQAAGAFGLRVEADQAKRETTVVILQRGDMSPEVAAKAAEIQKRLGLSPELDRYRLVLSPLRGAADELAVTSRSMLQILTAFAVRIDVPQEHLRDGRAPPMPVPPPLFEGDVPSRIHCGKRRPADAYAAVPYHDHWYWIDDRDWPTKRAFVAVMLFFTLAEGAGAQAPLITIPAQ
jgi:hypothetical protein